MWRQIARLERRLIRSAPVSTRCCPHRLIIAHPSSAVFWWVTQYGPLSILKTMMTSSNENIFRVTGYLCWEFTGHWWGWWFEMPSCPLWRQCNDYIVGFVQYCSNSSTLAVYISIFCAYISVFSVLCISSNDCGRGFIFCFSFFRTSRMNSLASWNWIRLLWTPPVSPACNNLLVWAFIIDF